MKNKQFKHPKQLPNNRRNGGQLNDLVMRFFYISESFQPPLKINAICFGVIFLFLYPICFLNARTVFANCIPFYFTSSKPFLQSNSKYFPYSDNTSSLDQTINLLA